MLRVGVSLQKDREIIPLQRAVISYTFQVKEVFLYKIGWSGHPIEHT